MKDTDLGDIVITFVDHQFKQNIGAPQWYKKVRKALPRSEDMSQKVWPWLQKKIKEEKPFFPKLI